MPEQIQLTFKCDEKISAMSKCADGFHCSKCVKTVVDYRNLDLVEFREKIQSNTGSTCGVYKPHHIEGGLTGWKEKLARKYRTLHIGKKKRGLNLIPIGFIGSLLFLVSCGSRQVCGAYGKSNVSKNKVETKTISTHKEIIKQNVEDVLPGKKR